MSKTKTKAGERLPYLFSRLKAPRVLERLQATAERARAEQWPYEQFLEKGYRPSSSRLRVRDCGAALALRPEGRG